MRESYDVLKPGGTLFHEWGNGDADEAWVQVREKTRSLFQEAGLKTPFHPGATSEVEVDSCLRDLGFHRREHIEAGVGPAITLADFLNKIQNRKFLYIWNVPRIFRIFAFHRCDIGVRATSIFINPLRCQPNSVGACTKNAK
jgi:hypothetical protein